MSRINIYRFVKMIYPNYVKLFYSNKNRRHYVSIGIDKYISIYINYIDKKILYLKDYINKIKICINVNIETDKYVKVKS